MKKMKYNAFTLAEVLITLAIIGVVAGFNAAIVDAILQKMCSINRIILF